MGKLGCVFKRASSKKGNVDDLIAYNGIVLLLVTLGNMLIKGISFNFFAYAYASRDAAIASPFIASFSAVSIILSRIFLNEKITKNQYILVSLIIAGMFILSIELRK